MEVTWGQMLKSLLMVKAAILEVSRGQMLKFLLMVKAAILGITVEPLMFLHEMSNAMHASLDSQLTMAKVCEVGSDWFSNGKRFFRIFCSF